LYWVFIYFFDDFVYFFFFPFPINSAIHSEARRLRDPAWHVPRAFGARLSFPRDEESVFAVQADSGAGVNRFLIEIGCISFSLFVFLLMSYIYIMFLFNFKLRYLFFRLRNPCD
jgi:hypothetical protein